MQWQKKRIPLHFRASQHSAAIGIGTSRDKRHFFLSKIVQLKVRQEKMNSLEMKNRKKIIVSVYYQ
jgi:hypothetical protein